MNVNNMNGGYGGKQSLLWEGEGSEMKKVEGYLGEQPPDSSMKLGEGDVQTFQFAEDDLPPFDDPLAPPYDKTERNVSGLTPKGHPEIAGCGIEYSWGYLKTVFRRDNECVAKNLHANIVKAQDSEVNMKL